MLVRSVGRPFYCIIFSNSSYIYDATYRPFISNRSNAVLTFTARVPGRRCTALRRPTHVFALHLHQPARPPSNSFAKRRHAECRPITSNSMSNTVSRRRRGTVIINFFISNYNLVTFSSPTYPFIHPTADLASEQRFSSFASITVGYRKSFIRRRSFQLGSKHIFAHRPPWPVFKFKSNRIFNSESEFRLPIYLV